jgi:ubiquinone/menaquinone biosynthesis C-methylase UbiE
VGTRVPLLQEPIAERDTVEQYDKGAKRYMAPEYRYFVRKILSRGIRQGRVLDIGSGSGLLALELSSAKRGDFEITAIDVSADMLRKAKENTLRAGQEDRMKFLVSTGAALPFPDDTFDLVISYASLHHWLDPVAVLDEAGRVVKESGRIIIRDNKRVHRNSLWGFVVWAVSRFMNRRHRESWYKAIFASYTLPEIEEILGRSRLRDCRIGSDFVQVDLCIESPGSVHARRSSSQ